MSDSRNRYSWMAWVAMLSIAAVLCLILAVGGTWFWRDDSEIWVTVFNWLMMPVMGWAAWYEFTAPRREAERRARDQEIFKKQIEELGINKPYDED